MKDKLVVYTAIFGYYDDLINPKENYKECDFICFTDRNDLKSDIWKIRVVKDINLSSNMMNRKYKLFPHLFLPEYKQSLYIDANIGIIGNPYKLATKYLSNCDMAVPRHFARNCVYDEAKTCIILGRSKLKKTINQIRKYKNSGFPKNFGLSENNIILRNHNKKKL